MLTCSILRNAKAPECCEFELHAGSLDIDMREVSEVTCEVRQADGATQTWATEILAGATSASMTARHTFDALGAETESACRYAIVATATTPDGPVRFGPFYLIVNDWASPAR